MADPDPTFYVDADPDLDPNFILICMENKIVFKSSTKFFKILINLYCFNFICTNYLVEKEG